MRKNITTLSLENIKSFSKNIISHFTGKEKIITLISAIIMLSFANITLSFPNIFNGPNVSALSYQSSVGVGFTFNPTLSVSISPSNLVIDNLTPGTTGDSNTINVSVATNAAYGYTLSAIMNGDSGNLIHTNGTNVFNSIATDADLTNLTTDNTWGYSYKNNLASTPTWSSYSGLSNSVDKVLFNTDNNSSGSIDFKIAAKTSSTQPSGTYTGTINFTVTTKPMPKTIQDIAYMQTFAELDAVDLASVKSSMILNNAYILKDIRDEKEYYVTKLEDGNVWMTQNLDLDIDETKTYTHYDTDLGWDDPDNLDINATWQPDRSTIDFTIGSSIPSWVNSNTEPYSANPGDVYFYTSNSNADDIQYNSLRECLNAGHNDCEHYYVGNYYNWGATIASNNAGDISNSNAPDSVCPSGWRLPKAQSFNEYANLLLANGIIDSIGSTTYTENGFIRVRIAPLYFSRSGHIDNGVLHYSKSQGNYLTSLTYFGSPRARNLSIYATGIYTKNDNDFKPSGFSVRCLAR